MNNKSEAICKKEIDNIIIKHLCPKVDKEFLNRIQTGKRNKLIESFFEFMGDSQGLNQREIIAELEEHGIDVNLLLKRGKKMIEKNK